MDFQVDQETLTTYGIEYGTSLMGAVLIFIIGKLIAKLLVNFLKNGLQKSKVDKTLILFIGNIVYGLAMAFVVIAALGQLGIQTASLAAILAAAGLAVGLALQGSLSNFAAGVLVILFRPFKIGDFIEAGGATGTVEDISIFTTTIKTGDNKTIITPNSAVTSGNIVNYSTKKERRVDMVFGCGYDDDIKKVKKTLEDIVKSDKRILKDPAPTIAINELADSSVNFVVRPWVKSEDYWAVFFDMHEKVKLEFDKKGLSIPYPQQDLHIQAVPAEITKLKKAA